MTIIGNFLWFIPGLFMAAGWFFSGIGCCMTIIGIPFGIASFRIARLCLWPFGYEVQHAEQKVGCVSTVFNILWLLPGVFIAVGHLLWAALFAIFIVTIPFAKQHMKLAALSLAPFGKQIVKAPVDTVIMMPVMTKKSALITGGAFFLVLPIFAVLFSGPSSQPLKAEAPIVKSSATSIPESTPEVKTPQTAVSADQLCVNLSSAIKTNDAPKIKVYIETAQRENFTTIVQMLETSGWMRWKKQQDDPVGSAFQVILSEESNVSGTNCKYERVLLFNLDPVIVANIHAKFLERRTKSRIPMFWHFVDTDKVGPFLGMGGTFNSELFEKTYPQATEDQTDKYLDQVMMHVRYDTSVAGGLYYNDWGFHVPNADGTKRSDNMVWITENDGKINETNVQLVRRHLQNSGQLILQVTAVATPATTSRPRLATKFTPQQHQKAEDFIAEGQKN